jgi:HD-GYP domain-containing protein (c-di-GMP phosphodiesterase class II)
MTRRSRPRRLVLLCGLVPTLLAAVLSLYRPAFLTGLDSGVYDTLLRAVPTRAPSDRIVIVDVDERSLATVGQWPWRRDVIGQLIGRLRDLGAAVVALDIVFAEPDRFERDEVHSDDALAQTLRAGRVVLGYAMTFDGSHHAARTCVQHPLGLAIVQPADEQADSPFFHATGAVCNLESLSMAAGASGFMNAAPDPDGILRRVPMLVEYDGRVYPALSLAAVSMATGTRPSAIRVANVNSATLLISGGSQDRVVALDGKSNLFVRYRGDKRTFPYVSAADVLSGQAGPATVANKIVFIGTTALGTREVVATPLDTLFAGVEVQATAADNLLHQDFLSRPEHRVALETQLVIGLGAIAGLLFLRFGLLWGVLGTATCGAAMWGASFLLMSGGGTFLSPLFPTIGLTTALAAMTAAGLTVERRRAEKAGQEQATSQRLMVQTLLSLTGIRDAETGRHSLRTQKYTRVLAEQLSTHPAFHDYLTPERIELLASLAPLHDIGKVGVPDRVLNKPGALTPDELAEMRMHPVFGRDVIVNAERAAGVRDDLTLAIAKDIVYTHHEKWDGSGYPEGLKGTQIPIPGRVMAIVDVYDAIRTRQLYRSPMSQDEAVEFIVKGNGTHFDPAVVEAFVKVSPMLHHLSQDER